MFGPNEVDVSNVGEVLSILEKIQNTPSDHKEIKRFELWKVAGIALNMRGTKRSPEKQLPVLRLITKEGFRFGRLHGIKNDTRAVGEWLVGLVQTYEDYQNALSHLSDLCGCCEQQRIKVSINPSRISREDDLIVSGPLFREGRTAARTLDRLIASLIPKMKLLLSNK